MQNNIFKYISAEWRLFSLSGSFMSRFFPAVRAEGGELSAAVRYYPLLGLLLVPAVIENSAARGTVRCRAYLRAGADFTEQRRVERRFFWAAIIGGELCAFLALWVG